MKVISFNAHVGLALRSSGLKWLLLRNPLVSIVLVQEGRGADELKRNLGRRFRTWPKDQGNSKEDAMTYVAWLRGRYRFVNGWNHNIRHGGQYPRKCTAVLLWDRLRRRYTLAISIHLDPMGRGWQAPDSVIKAHQAQMKEYVDLIKEVKAHYPGVFIVAGGDVNEILEQEPPDKYKPLSAKVALRKLGLEPSIMHRLDGIWFSKGARRGKRTRVPREGIDHDSLVGTAG